MRKTKSMPKLSVNSSSNLNRSNRNRLNCSRRNRDKKRSFWRKINNTTICKMKSRSPERSSRSSDRNIGKHRLN